MNFDILYMMEIQQNSIIAYSEKLIQTEILARVDACNAHVCHLHVHSLLLSPDQRLARYAAGYISAISVSPQCHCGHVSGAQFHVHLLYKKQVIENIFQYTLPPRRSRCRTRTFCQH